MPGSITSTINDKYNPIRTIRQDNSHITINRFAVIRSNINEYVNVSVRIGSHIAHSSMSRNRQDFNVTNAFRSEVSLVTIINGAVCVIAWSVVRRNMPGSITGTINDFHSLIGTVREVNSHVSVNDLTVIRSNVNGYVNGSVRIGSHIAHSSMSRYFCSDIHCTDCFVGFWSFYNRSIVECTSSCYFNDNSEEC